MGAEKMTTMESLTMWRNVTVRAMNELDFDLSARQTSILLTVYLEDGPHTVKNLSENLSISKAAVCRALDKLSIARLLKRRKDENDKRNIFVQRTIHGSVFLSDFADIVLKENVSVKDDESTSVKKDAAVPSL